jgi:hypothetical protein
MSRCILLAALAGHLLAQQATDLFSKAPPDVDTALRVRIGKFYQAHVDGKPRLAEEFVAEESKDQFYNSKKPKYLSFEILKLDYSENFTKATVTTLVETFVPMVGFANKPMKLPLLSFWKIENQQWCWYLDLEKMSITPFGKMGTSPGPAPNAPPPDLSKGPDVNAVMRQVTADKTSVVFKRGEASTGEVTITNSMPGSVTVALPDQPLPGIDVSLPVKQLKAGQKAAVVIRYTPLQNPPKGPLTVHVEVQPINRLIPIQIQFQ